jgi:hypothetical protein
MSSVSHNPLSFDSRGESINVTLEWSVPLPLDATFSTLFYKFSTTDGDINFAINFIDQSGNSTPVLPMTRYPSDETEITGKCEFNSAGIAVLIWDNSHAWYGSKILKYLAHVRKVFITAL